jgi:hypothetical protein
VSLTPVDLVSAHPWQRAVFTTYALSLSFFEAVILDALVRGEGRSQPLILADVQGVRGSLSEQGARRVGKDYEVEPVAVSNGVFHPKISVLSSPDGCHVLVGSGNLTFGGWGGNCEIVEHLHPGFAADALADTARFFELMLTSDRVRHGAAEQCAATAADLRRSIQGKPTNGGIRLFHNLDASLGEQIAQAAADLGGAGRLVAAAPFWDDGGAIDRLCLAIGLSEVFVHSHERGCVEGIAGANWPRRARTPVRAVRVEVIDRADESARLLHAKAFEIVCKRGRILVSGSANGTTAALGRNHNVEACVVRVQRERTVGWTLADAEPPYPQAEAEETADSEEEAGSGVLRATLEGDQVRGEVLTPGMGGSVSVHHLGPMGPELLAETVLGPNAAFGIVAPDLERWAWRGGRIVIRVRDGSGKQAEGFVSVASFAEIAQRTGLVGRRLFALLAGNETPADVAAILAWFHDAPDRIVPADPNSLAGGADTRRDGLDRPIPVANLADAYVEGFPARVPDHATHPHWSRFIDQIFAAFREPRGPLFNTETKRGGEDDEDEVLDEPAEPEEVDDPDIDKSFAVFERLFKLWTKDGAPARYALVAFDLAQYVCDRLRDRLRPDPARAKVWLERLTTILPNVGVPPHRRDDVAAAVLTILGMSPQRELIRLARGRLLALGVDLRGEPPSAQGVRSFQALLPQVAPFAELWTRLGEVLTYQEQVRSYLEALEAGRPSNGYPDLPGAAPEEWPVLEDALTSKHSRRRLVMAKGPLETHCNIRLPTVAIHKLRSTGIATTGCCHRILIWPGD